MITALVSLTCGDYDFETDEDDAKPEEIGTMQLFEHPSFVMGSGERTYESRGEYPKRWEYTRPFRIDRYPVTVADFQNFVSEKDYHTTQSDSNQFSYVFHKHLDKTSEIDKSQYVVDEPWMIPAVEARWDNPYANNINISSIKLNPVVHVGFADAHRYCQHINKRLPTEFEWELAARTNNYSWDYPWGPMMRRNRMNIWQGMFPNHDHGYDGHTHISPVNAYPAQNDLGMYDMLGNVWEWTTTEYFGTDLPSDEIRRHWVILKGGSFLDTLDGESRTSPVRCSIKITRPYFYTAENVGFRCAQDANDEKIKREPRIHRYEDTKEYRDHVQRLAKKFIILRQRINRTVTHKPKPKPVHQHYFELKDEL